MYEKWLSDDGEKLRLTKQQILDMREKINKVKDSQDTKHSILMEKEDALGDKEDVLSVSIMIVAFVTLCWWCEMKLRRAMMNLRMFSICWFVCVCVRLVTW